MLLGRQDLDLRAVIRYLAGYAAALCRSATGHIPDKPDLTAQELLASVAAIVSLNVPGPTETASSPPAKPLIRRYNRTRDPLLCKHAKVIPFRETTMFKAFVFAAVTPAAAGVAATGGAVATHHLGGNTVPGAYYGVPVYDHSDPYHSDPGGEWILIEASPTIGTASTNHQVIVPNG